jgi:glutathione synthase/RimK-type ligase-like ATP-grasp enzyme
VSIPLRIALASCASLPAWEVDDKPLHAALAAHGVIVETPAWDDANVDWQRLDACLIRTTWDYMDRRSAYLDWAERTAAATTLFNPAAIVRWNTDKGYLADLERLGAAVIPTVWLAAGSSPDVAAILAEHGWTRAFLKPAVGASSLGTLRFDADVLGLAAARAHLEQLLPRETMLLQPYLPTVETIGELSAIFFDGKFSHGVRKIPPAGDYRVQDDYGARDLPHEFSAVELRQAREILDLVPAACPTWRASADEPLLYARVDFLAGRDGRLLLTELELVEPSLFFRHAPAAADVLAAALVERLRGEGRR